MKTNYHTHIYLCKHATGTVNDYVEKAIAHGYKEIGISDHGPLTEELMNRLNSRRMNFDEFYKIYLPDLEYAKINYSDKINVLSAVEIEYMDEIADIYPEFLKVLDYLVLGQHMIYENGEYINVYAKEYTAEEIALYAQTIEKALDTGY